MKINQTLKSIFSLCLFFSLPTIFLSAQDDITILHNASFNFGCGTSTSINILDVDGDVTDIVGVAPWSFIFEQGTIAAVEQSLENFNENSIDRFFVEVEKEGVAGDEIFGELSSLLGTNEIDKISLMKFTRVSTSNRFRSTPIILVTDNDKIDDDFDEDNCSDPPGTWDNVDDIDIDPTIFGVIGGHIKASFDSEEAIVNICEGAIKTVTVNAYIMQSSNGTPYAIQSFVESQLDKAIDLMGMACLEVNYSIQFLTEGVGVDLSNGIDIPLQLVESDEMEKLIQPVKDLSSGNQEIDIIFLNHFTGSPDKGIALRDETTLAPNYIESHRRTIIIASDNAVEVTTAHEIGHILTNKGHYRVDYDQSDLNGLEFFNLMKDGTAPCNGVFETKRLKSSQIGMLRSNTDIPQ